MRLLCFSHSSFLGGAERCLIDMVRGLAQHGVVCSVIVPANGPLVTLLEEAGAAVFAPQKPLTWWVHLPEKVFSEHDMISSYETLKSEILPFSSAFAPDMILSQTLVSPWGAITAELLQVPHILSVREYGTLDHRFMFPRHFAKCLEALYSDSALIFCVSDDVGKTLFSQDLEHKVQTIYAAIDIPAEYAMDPRRNFAHTLGHSRSPLKLLILGAVTRGKRPHDAIMATNELLKSGFEVELRIVGPQSDEDYFQELKQLVETQHCGSSVAFFPFTNDPFAEILNSDIVLSCSANEALGRTLLEAALCERPIVYPRSAGPFEVFGEAEYGLAYEPGDTRDLAKMIAKTVQNNEETNQRVVAARKMVETRFNREQYTSKIYQGLEKLRPDRPFAADGSTRNLIEQFDYQQAYANVLEVNAGLSDSIAKWKAYFDQTVLDKDAVIGGLERSVEEWRVYFHNVVQNRDEQITLKDQQLRRLTNYVTTGVVDVSIIVVNYNGQRFLGPLYDALDALVPQSPTFEVILVDNRSTDGSLEYLAQRKMTFPHKVVRSPENLGFAGGNNWGALHAVGRFLTFLNNDTAPDPRWLLSLSGAAARSGVGIVTSKLVFMPRFLKVSVTTNDQFHLSPRFELNSESLAVETKFTSHALCHPTTWVCFGNTVFYVPLPSTLGELEFVWPVTQWSQPSDCLHIAGSVISVAEHYRDGALHFHLDADSVKSHAVNLIQNAGSALNRDLDGYDIGFGQEDRGQFDQSREVPSVCGAAMMMKKSLFFKVGGFDSLFFMYYEDVDLALRVTRAGYRLEYCPEAYVRHVHTGTSKEWSPFFVYHVQRNKLLMLLKNFHFRKFFLAFARYAVALRHVAPSERTIRLRVIWGVLNYGPKGLVRLWNRVWTNKSTGRLSTLVK